MNIFVLPTFSKNSRLYRVFQLLDPCRFNPNFDFFHIAWESLVWSSIQSYLEQTLEGNLETVLETWRGPWRLVFEEDNFHIEGFLEELLSHNWKTCRRFFLKNSSKEATLLKIHWREIGSIIEVDLEGTLGNMMFCWSPHGVSWRNCLGTMKSSGDTF